MTWNQVIAAATRPVVGVFVCVSWTDHARPSKPIQPGHGLGGGLAHHHSCLLSKRAPWLLSKMAPQELSWGFESPVPLRTNAVYTGREPPKKLLDPEGPFWLCARWLSLRPRPPFTLTLLSSRTPLSAGQTLCIDSPLPRCQLGSQTHRPFSQPTSDPLNSAWKFVLLFWVFWRSVVLFSVTQSCPAPCTPMDCSPPGFPVLHYLPEFAQTHVHWVGEAIRQCVHSKVQTLLKETDMIFPALTSSLTC